MCKPVINLPASLILALGLLAAHPTMAGKEDFKKEVEIYAQKQLADGKRKVSIFKGDVEIKQGSLNILADELETDASNGDGKEVLIARGAPASYRQQTDDGETITAQANEIRYDVFTRILTLNGEAEVFQNASRVRGESIVYNMEQEQLVAEGGESSEGRVTTIIRPEVVDSSDSKQEPTP